jgi:Domain of unknown function (DUF4126)
MLGLLAHTGALALPPELHFAADGYVIAACCLLFAAEFIGDKIPIFDLLWNAVHTFVRVPVAAFIAYAATPTLPAGERLIATFFGALIALAAHGGKTAARVAVTPSPEPASNFALSLSEDAAVVFLTWFATRHPFIAAAIVLVALAVIVITIRAIWSALSNLFRQPAATTATNQQSAE